MGGIDGGGTGGAAEQPRPSASATGFEQALEGLRATGASVTIRELVESLATHGTEEGRMLAAYERMATTASDPAVRYLIGLIMDDERRHHRMLVELATAMAWGTLGGVETSVPPLGWHLEDDVLAATRALRAYEEQDRRDLEALHKRLRPFEETTLWALIVKLMMLDTAKHATILRFLEHHSRAD